MNNNDTTQNKLIKILSSTNCISILLFLLEDNADISLISSKFNKTPATISYYLRMLYNAELIKYELNNLDLRRRRIILTQKGIDIAHRYKNGKMFE